MLLECLTHRLRGHYEGDPAPVPRGARRRRLAGEGPDPAPAAPRRSPRAGSTRTRPRAIEREADGGGRGRRCAFARASPFPPPELVEELVVRVTRDDLRARRSTARSHDAMRADERVFVIGEDVAEGGPVHRHRRPGRGVRHRARAATRRSARRRSAASRRRRPVGPAAGARDHVHRLRHARARPARQRGGEGALRCRAASSRVPLVLRTQGGAGQRGARAALAEPRGLADPRPRAEGRHAEPRGRRRRAAGSAIADPNPVVFVENKTLYFRREEVARRRPSRVPIGRRAHRAARAATSRSSRCRGWSARRWRPPSAWPREGIEAEVIDPRTLVPLDLDTIVASVRRTNRLVVAHEAVRHGGFGAEIAARGAGGAAFDDLDAPIERVGAPFAPDPVQPAARGRLPARRRRDRRGRARDGPRGGDGLMRAAVTTGPGTMVVQDVPEPGAPGARRGPRRPGGGRASAARTSTSSTAR